MDRKRVKVRKFLVFIAAAYLCGCATKTSFEKMEKVAEGSKARAAAYAADGFYSYNTPEREVQNWQFYYKNCMAERSGDFPKKSEWECGRPY